MVPRTLKGTEAISTEATSLRLPAGLITRRRKPLSPPCESSVPSGPSAKPTLCSIAGAGRQDRTPLSRLASSVAAPRGYRHTVPSPCGETPFRKPCRPTSRSLASGQLHLTPDSAAAPGARPASGSLSRPSSRCTPGLRAGCSRGLERSSPVFSPGRLLLVMTSLIRTFLSPGRFPVGRRLLSPPCTTQHQGRCSRRGPRQPYLLALQT